MTDDTETKQGPTGFVSAAAHTDTSAVISALSASGVQVRSAKNVSSGENIAAALSNAILAADFVCIVLDHKPMSPVVAFEAGIATGVRRPLVIISSGRLEEIELSPLADMSRILYSNDENGRTTLSRAINAFVENIRPVSAELPISWEEFSNPPSSHTTTSQIHAVGLERYIAERLERTGALVNTEDHTADILATFATLGAAGGLVVVEVKTRHGGAKQQHQNEQKLQKAMMDNNSLMGLLIYGEPVETRIKHDAESLLGGLFGGILITSTDQLSKWTDADLLRELHQLRNIVIHGQR